MTGPQIAGSKTIAIPAETPIPADVGFFRDILDAKRDALRRAFPTFTHALAEGFFFSPFAASYPDCQDTSLSPSEIGMELGGRYVSTSYTLSGIATQALLVWDAFTITTTDNPTGTVSRRYDKLINPSWIEARVDFNGAIPSDLVSNGSVFAVGAPGSDFRIRFDNTGPGDKLFVSNWVLLYRLLLLCVGVFHERVVWSWCVPCSFSYGYRI